MKLGDCDVTSEIANNYNSKNYNCIRSLRVVKTFLISYRSCLHPLHLIGCFSYVFALYTFVLFFFLERFADFFNIQVLSTSVPYVFALYTFVTHFERCI